MSPSRIPDLSMAASITRAASQQTYLTVRFLVDRPLVADAYRAYAYFRWIDDTLDKDLLPIPDRLAFLQRQQTLVETCSRGQPPAEVSLEEGFLVKLMARETDKSSGLHAYIRHLMMVMGFDASRRGRLISQRELSEYSHNLAVAVTEAMHYFIGHCCTSPHNAARYSAVTGAHITHMLRDAIEDAEAGYYNIPAEIVALHGIDPADVTHPVYRSWVKGRVKEARACFQIGCQYLAQVKNFRCRLAGFAYTQRFEDVLAAIEEDGYLLRKSYADIQKDHSNVLMLWHAFQLAISRRTSQPVSHALPVR